MLKPQPVIHLAAAVITSPNKQLLLVRKRGSAFFMQAGGKIEPNEQPIAALIRELNEEIALTVTADQLHYLGHFHAAAANEAHHRVSAELYHLSIDYYPFQPAAELAEVRWVTLADAKQLQLAPLTREIILPLTAPMIG